MAKKIKSIAILLCIILSIVTSVSATTAETDANIILNDIMITDNNDQEFSDHNKAMPSDGIIIRLNLQVSNYDGENTAPLEIDLPKGILLDNLSGQSDNGLFSYSVDTVRINIEITDSLLEDGVTDTDILILNAHFDEYMEEYLSEGNLVLLFNDFDTEITIPFAETEDDLDIDDPSLEESIPHEPENNLFPANERPQNQTVSSAAADQDVQTVLDKYRTVETKEVGSFDTLKSVLLNLSADSNTITHIKFTDNISAPANADSATIGSTSDGTSNSYVNGNFLMDGGGQYTLNMGLGAIKVTSSHNLYVYNLNLRQNTTEDGKWYFAGFFCIIGGGGASADIHWDAAFHNLDFEGSALVGAQQYDAYTNQRRFDTVTFTGNTRIYVSGYGAGNAVIYARNVYIHDNFEMTGESTLSGSHENDAMTQFYFLSAGVKGNTSRQYEITDESAYNNSVSRGLFYVAEDADVFIMRAPSKYNQSPSTTDNGGNKYSSLIFGYAEYEFGSDSTFYGKAGTNRYYGGISSQLYTTAIIKSVNVSRFYIGSNANVTLETDGSTTTYPNQHGFTALYLGKRNHLDFTIGKSSSLAAISKGVAELGGVDSKRALAPVILTGIGSSTTTILGTFTIESATGNGWYYEYRTASSGTQTFIVDGQDAVFDINATCAGTSTLQEYAGFEGYGHYEVYIEVRNGATMNILTKGRRGFSLAAADKDRIKSIDVSGEGSSLTVSGIVWAIAAEGRSDLKISATDHGKISFISAGDLEEYGPGGDAPSTIYAVGRTNILADTEGEISVFHRGGTYSAIFQDGGPLGITVKNKAVMTVENYNSGNDIAARRAAVTVQNPTHGVMYTTPYDSYINVSEEGTFSVVNHNNEVHSSSGTEQQRYSVGAINFGGYTGDNSKSGGSITVRNGGNFYAVSNSPTATIFMNYGTITFDNPGSFEIRNNSDKATVVTNSSNLNKNPYSNNGSDMANVGQAIYIGYTTETMYKNLSLTEEVVSFSNTDVTVWQVGKNHPEYSGGGYADTQIDVYWKGTDISASIGTASTASTNGRIVTGTSNVLGRWISPVTSTDVFGNQYTDQFVLQAYGRIMGSGEGSPSKDNANLILKKDADKEQIELDEMFTYTINVSNTWLEGITDPNRNGEVNDTIWTNISLTDELDYRLDFVECLDEGVTVVETSGTDIAGNTITVLKITIDKVKANEEFQVNLMVKPNENASIGDVMVNQAASTGMEDLVSSNIVRKPEITGPDGDISKVSNAENGQAYIGSSFTYTITAVNNGTSSWQDVTAIDLLPDELQYVTFESSDDVTLHNNGNELELNFGSIAANGGSKQIVITVKVKNDAEDGITIYNTVTTADGKSATDDGTKIMGIGSITVEKYGPGDTPMENVDFTIEYYDSSGDGRWIYIKWDKQTRNWIEDTAAEGHYTQSTSVNQDGTAADTVFKDLPIGKYRITEVSSPDGYITLLEPFTGTIPTPDADGNPVYHIKFSIYNDRILDMPYAGRGITPEKIILIGFILAAFAGAGYCIRRRMKRIQ